jgi:hypothetical protein
VCSLLLGACTGSLFLLGHWILDGFVALVLITWKHPVKFEILYRLKRSLCTSLGVEGTERQQSKITKIFMVKLDEYSLEMSDFL